MKKDIISTAHTGMLLKWPSLRKWRVMDYDDAAMQLKAGSLVLFLGYRIVKYPGASIVEARHGTNLRVCLLALADEKIARVMLYPKHYHNRKMPNGLQDINEIERSTCNLFAIGETVELMNT